MKKTEEELRLKIMKVLFAFYEGNGTYADLRVDDIMKLLFQAITERDEYWNKKFTIIGGNNRIGCSDAKIKEDKDGQLSCIVCGKDFGNSSHLQEKERII